MGRALEYPDGTFCWIELLTPDPDRAARFYGELFGWDTRTDAGLWRAAVDGQLVAGLREVAAPGGWRQYVRTAGGSTPAERLVDPEGAELWTNPAVTAELVNEPRTWSWCELGATDVDAQSTFWAQRLGWTSERASEPIERATFWLGQLLIAGAHAARPGEPFGWQVTFRVDDVDATVAAAARLGGKVPVEPIDIPIGRLAVIADPDGATASVSSFEAPFRGVDGS